MLPKAEVYKYGVDSEGNSIPEVIGVNHDVTPLDIAQAVGIGELGVVQMPWGWIESEAGLGFRGSTNRRIRGTAQVGGSTVTLQARSLRANPSGQVE